MPMIGEQKNCISAHTVANTPNISAARAVSPCRKSCTRRGSTGMMIPIASTSSTTVMKMKVMAAWRAGAGAAGDWDIGEGRSWEWRRRRSLNSRHPRRQQLRRHGQRLDELAERVEVAQVQSLARRVRIPARPREPDVRRAEHADGRTVGTALRRADLERNTCRARGRRHAFTFDA